MTVEEFPNRIIKIDNEKYIYFGGTAYLGLPPNKKFQKIAAKNIKRWGTAYGSSRNANIKLSAYEKGETFLAEFIQSQAALTVSSGMLAAQLVLKHLEFENFLFYHFPNNHKAISHNNSSPFFINGKINPRILDNTTEKIAILTDAVPSNSVNAVDLTVLEQIPNHKEIALVIDESHSLGIVGKDGCGLYSSIQYSNIQHKILVSSLGKALGVSGGVVAGSSVFIEKLKNNDLFVSSAGMNPAFVNTIAEAKKIIKKQQKKLQENLNYLGSKLATNKKILFEQDYPVIYPKIENINTILASKKIIITNFKYNSDNEYLNRIIITANHKKKDLNKIIKILNEYQNEQTS